MLLELYAAAAPPLAGVSSIALMSSVAGLVRSTPAAVGPLTWRMLLISECCQRDSRLATEYLLMREGMENPFVCSRPALCHPRYAAAEDPTERTGTFLSHPPDGFRSCGAAAITSLSAGDSVAAAAAQYRLP